MNYNYKKIGKLVAEVIESGGQVYLHKIENNENIQSPQQALSFMDRSREAFLLEDKALLVKEHITKPNYFYYKTSKEYPTINLLSSFEKVGEEK